MKLQLCAVFDRAISSFGRPFVVTHVGAAVRSFMDELGNKESELGKHPDDYDLFHVGEFDDQKGEVIAVPPVMLLAGKQGIARGPVEVKRAS